MSRRFLTSGGMLVAVAAMWGASAAPTSLMSALGVVHAQTPAAGQGTYKGPRTAWGHPDLQGIWNNTVSTPLQRPRRFAGKALLTDEELAAYTKEQQGSRENRDGRQQQPGAVTDVARAYNALWFPIPEPPLRRTSLIVSPADGRMPPLRPEAIKRAELHAAAIGATGSTASPTGRAEGVVDGTEGGVDGRGGRADNPEDRDLGDRCLSDDLPRMPGGYNNHFQIVQTADTVAIEVEMRHHVRVIPLTSRPALPSNVSQWYGDSRGRWEGDTLVIETTNFSPKGNFNGASENLRLVERIKRVDASTISYEATMTDPTTWDMPWTVEFPWTNLDKLVGGIDDVSVPMMFEYACHEGNYGLLGILNGGRADDKKAGGVTASRAR